MKNYLKSWRMAALTLSVLALSWGCATTEQTDKLLTQAGFKSVPAKTPQQEAHLQTLSTHKLTKVVRDGKDYYVYPDRQHHILYVGQAEQYEKYRKLKTTQEWAEEANNPVSNQITSYDVWGAW